MNELEQNAPLIQEAVDKCRKGNCKYYGEGRTGIAWLVTLSDGQQHILKVMFGPDTRNRFTVRGHSDNKTSGHDKPEHITQANDFAKIVYMTNRVTQLEAFGVLENHLNHKPIAFYILMPYLGLSFRLAFDKHRHKFTNKDGIFVWADRSEIVSAYCSSYAVKQIDFFWDNFVFNEEPWDVRLVDWSEGWDLLFKPPYRPTYQQIAKIVVQVQDPNLHGYYNDKTNNDHEKTAQQTAEFFAKLHAGKILSSSKKTATKASRRSKAESSSKTSTKTTMITNNKLDNVKNEDDFAKEHESDRED
ncbi:hypothetical protein H0H93_009776 [Arthromyces matolae]|nr:hypothetical protein H0H93_009776 [Arthromyces matolae]